jgi:hypothetical protein
MQLNAWGLAVGLVLTLTLSAKAQVVKGIMSVTGAEMN